VIRGLVLKKPFIMYVLKFKHVLLNFLTFPLLIKEQICVRSRKFNFPKCRP